MSVLIYQWVLLHDKPLSIGLSIWERRRGRRVSVLSVAVLEKKNRIKASSQYKKDYKRFRNNPAKVGKLFAILEKLKNEQPIPYENRPQCH